MAFLETYGKEIVSLLVPIIAWALNSFFKSNAKLLLGQPHSFTFLVQEPLKDPEGRQLSPTQSVYTTSFVIRNSGRETAENVELVFNWKPQCINVWPSRHFDERVEHDNRYTMSFRSLAPKEDLGFELMSINHPLPILIVVRCDQCVAENIDMFPQPMAKPWKVRVTLFLALAGLSAVVYSAILLLQFLILVTPYGR
jgi:hypothetical protein